jgi:transposase
MRYELPIFEWVAINSLLPNKPRGIPRVDDRRVLNGIFWVLRSGAPWRDLPASLVPAPLAIIALSGRVADSRWPPGMLGMELFERKGRRLLLTQHGQRYSDAINVAFGVIERAGDEMRPAGSARVFRLGMRSAFAAYWFLPRLDNLIAARMGFDLCTPQLSADVILMASRDDPWSPCVYVRRLCRTP